MLKRLAAFCRCVGLACVLFIFVSGFHRDYAWAEDKTAAPQFDAVVVEEKSLIIKGTAASLTHVELVNGADVIGEAQTSIQGVFSILPLHSLKSGEYRFVLRSTDSNGHSATSLQTLLVRVPGKDGGSILALVKEPGKSSRLLSGQDKAGLTAVATKQDFAVESIAFLAGTLSVCGKSPPQMQVFITMAGRTIGSGRTSQKGKFCIIRNVALETGDYILQASLFDDRGTEIMTISLPFTIGKYQGAVRQVYRNGQAVDTVVIKRGETLSRIAKRVYGNAALAGILFAANRDVLQTPGKIRAGAELVVPRQEKQ